MFPARWTDDRQAKLEPVLIALRQIKGIVDVWKDDFDSSAINVFLTIKGADPFRPAKSPVMAFALPMRYTKAAIRQACKQAGVEFRFLDWPTMRYSYMTVLGRRYKNKDGYDQSTIKIEVYV